jgi:enolase-phosphatase E1
MISHILLDIEGTTCPVSFVTETLFPYAQLALRDFLKRHKDDPSISRLINNAEDEWMQDQDKQSATLRHSSEKIQQPKHLKIESYLQLLIALDKEINGP